MYTNMPNSSAIQCAPPSQVVLLIGPGWGDSFGGISAVNTTLALQLTGHKRLEVHCAVFDGVDDNSLPETIDNAQVPRVNIVQLRPEPAVDGVPSIGELYSDFSEHPKWVCTEIGWGGGGGRVG